MCATQNPKPQTGRLQSSQRQLAGEKEKELKALTNCEEKVKFQSYLAPRHPEGKNHLPHNRDAAVLLVMPLDFGSLACYV